MIVIRINKEFVFIQQFRPALLFGASELSKQTIKNPNLGYWYVFSPHFIHSYELCAGLLDRTGRTKEQAIVDEIREELGYEVSEKDLVFIGRSKFHLPIYTVSSWFCGHFGCAYVHVLYGNYSSAEGFLVSNDF